MSVDTIAFRQLQEKAGRLHAAAPAAQVPPEARVERAKGVFRRRLDARQAAYLETCIHCGMCAEACHFYEATGDGKYAPIHKIEPLRRFYRRELAPMGWLRRLVLRDITAQDLEQWRPLVYDSCTLCGRCDMICPMGIHISPMVGIMREALTEAGLQPAEQTALATELAASGSLLGIGPDTCRAVASELRGRGVEVPLDKPQAEVMVLMNAMDASVFKDSIGATARILNRLGLDWTLRTGAGDAAAFDWLSGDERTHAAMTRRIVQDAVAAGVRTLIVPECGHGYAALRWGGANVLGGPLPFEVLAISEFVGREVQSGRLKVKKVAAPKTVTYHDPCKVGRWSGVLEEPRAALAAIGVELREMESHARTNYCCGGGGGVFLNDNAADLRKGAFRIKMKEADATGAEAVVTACGHCRLTFMAGAEQAHWQKPIESLVELVAANLEE